MGRFLGLRIRGLGDIKRIIAYNHVKKKLNADFEKSEKIKGIIKIVNLNTLQMQNRNEYNYKPLHDNF